MTFASILPFFATAADLIRRGYTQDLSPLVDAEWRDRVETRLSALPFSPHVAGYECRLAAGESRVDCAVALLPGTFPTEARSTMEFLDRVGSNPAWPRCLGFLSEWSGGALGNEVPFACIAFDMNDSEEDPLLAPCVSLCIDSGFFTRRLGGVAFARSPAHARELVAYCHRQLCAAELPSGAAEALKAVLSISGRVELKHLSFMLPRQPATTKLDIRVRVSDVGRLLERLEWPAAGVTAAALASLTREDAHIQLNLVLGRPWPGALEVEYFAGDDRGSGEIRRAFLWRLVDLGLCTGEKAEALHQVCRRPVVHAPKGGGVVRNWYAKVRFLPEGPQDAKAYIAFTPELAAWPLRPAASAGSLPGRAIG